MKANGVDESSEAVPRPILIPHPDSGVSALKAVGAVATLLGIIAVVLAASSAQLTSHKENPHAGAVTKEVYEAHEKKADERYEAIDKKLDRHDAKLDALLAQGK